MVKKLKAMAQERKDGTQMADAIRASAQQIWLAGLGAFAKARAERTKTFEVLVREGKNLQRKTRELAEERFGEVSDRVNEVKEKVNRQATESWDKLEQVFEDRVARALGRLGVPTLKDLQAISDRIDALAGAAPGKKATKAAKAAAPKAAKAAAPKAAKAAAPKAAKAAAPKAAKAAAPKTAKPRAPKASKAAPAPAPAAAPEAAPAANA